MGFKTIGWFGPYCAENTPNGRDPKEFIVHDYNSQEAAPQQIGGNVKFPLDVAMKIFWEASTFNIQSTIEATIGGTTKSDTVNVVVNWGQITDSTGFFNERGSISTAKEMLCAINPNQIKANHTLYREYVTNGRQFLFGISPQPYIDNGLLTFNFFCSHEIGPLFPVGEIFQKIKILEEQPQYGERIWNLYTPWGNYVLPLIVSRPLQTNTSVLSITVTGSNALERYA